MQVRIGVVRELPDVRSSKFKEIQIGQTRAHSGERNRMTIGCPRRIQDLIDALDRDLAIAFSGPHVENRKRCAPATNRAQRDMRARSVPGRGRVDELNAREVRIGGRARQPAHDSSRLGISDVQVGGEQTAG